MSFNRKKYIEKYNKENYKMYQFRVKYDDKKLIDFLDNINSRNNYIVNVLNNQISKSVFTIKELKEIIKPILKKHGIYKIFLFGSYSRGEANKNSDVDIYCEKGNIHTLIDVSKLEEELKRKLRKNVDVIFIGSSMDKHFKEQIEKDMIMLC